MTSVAPAAVKWVGGAAGNWNVAANWEDTGAPGTFRIPLATESADIGGIGVVVTVDSTAPAVCNLLRLAPAATDDVTLVISDSASSLSIVGTSQETMAVGKAGKGVVNQSAGSVLVSSTNTWGGEMRMTYAGSAYNLSGGTLNVGTIRKNNQSVDAAFNDTGGTIVMKYMYRIGPPSTSNLDMIWNQGASDLEVGGSIGVVTIGQSNYDQKHTTSDGSVIRIELASDASYDYGRASATANFTDGTLDLVAIGGYVQPSSPPLISGGWT